MRRYLLSLLLPALLLAACGQLTAVGPSAPTPGATTPGTPTQQALRGVFQIDFNGVGTETPTTRVQSLQLSGLSAQGLVSAPDQFSFSPVTVQTFTVPTTNTRHVRVTYKVTNTSSQTLRNPKFIAVVPQGGTTDSVFTNVRYFDGSDATAAISKLSLVQGQSFNTATNSALPDPLANTVLTGLDVSTVDTTGKGIKTLTQTGWWLTTPPTSGATIPMAPGDTALMTFGVNLPLTPAAEGGATKDPFNFSLNVTAVQDAAPLVAMTSVVKQWDAVAKTFGNYVKFPTRTYTENGATTTRSLPAYYDLSTLDGSTTTKVLCAGDANMSVTNISTATFPNRWRVQLFSLGDHTLKVFAGTSCPTDGTPLLSQTVTGMGTGGSSLAAGALHSLALKADGTVWSWGANNFGQLGNGLAIAQQIGPGPVGALSGIVSIAAGSYHNLTLRADGTVWSWGSNIIGQLGDGTKTQRTTPVVVSGLSDIVSIAAGGAYSLALKADGTVQSWGENAVGQLGDGTTTTRLTPVVVNGLSDVVGLTGGGKHSLALRADGTVQSWGANGSGQLGDGTTTTRLTPITVNGLSGVMSIDAGTGHSLALRTDGTVQSWGDNSSGQLGDGTTINRRTPVPVSTLSGIMSISTASASSLAVRTDGSVQSWGLNNEGQLGDGTTTNRSTPAPVSNLSGITRVAGGDNHSLALMANGIIQSWGDNFYGQLGDGTTTDRPTSGPVGGLTGVTQPTP